MFHGQRADMYLFGKNRLNVCLIFMKKTLTNSRNMCEKNHKNRNFPKNFYSLYFNALDFLWSNFFKHKFSSHIVEIFPKRTYIYILEISLKVYLFPNNKGNFCGLFELGDTPTKFDRRLSSENKKT